MMKKIFPLAVSVGLFCTGCVCENVNFIGMTKEQIAEKLGNGPKMKDGSFRVLHPLPDSPPNTMVNHVYQNKESLLSSHTAMNAPKWQVFFHSDGLVWHSYILAFEDDVAVSQEERRQPHWVWAEP